MSRHGRRESESTHHAPYRNCPLLATDIIIECGEDITTHDSQTAANAYQLHSYRGKKGIVAGSHERSDGNGIVLIQRKNPPYGLALPGGFAELGLTLEQNAMKEAREETGLEVMLEINPFCVRSNPERDPRAHVVSVVYIGKGTGTLQAGDDAASAQIYRIPRVLQLLSAQGTRAFAFDHGEIITDYLHSRGYLP